MTTNFNTEIKDIIWKADSKCSRYFSNLAEVTLAIGGIMPLKKTIYICVCERERLQDVLVCIFLPNDVQ